MNALVQFFLDNPGAWKALIVPLLSWTAIVATAGYGMGYFFWRERNATLREQNATLGEKNDLLKVHVELQDKLNPKNVEELVDAQVRLSDRRWKAEIEAAVEAATEAATKIKQGEIRLLEEQNRIAHMRLEEIAVGHDQEKAELMQQVEDRDTRIRILQGQLEEVGKMESDGVMTALASRIFMVSELRDAEHPATEPLTHTLTVNRDEPVDPKEIRQKVGFNLGPDFSNKLLHVHSGKSPKGGYRSFVTVHGPELRDFFVGSGWSRMELPSLVDEITGPLREWARIFVKYEEALSKAGFHPNTTVTGSNDGAYRMIDSKLQPGETMRLVLLVSSRQGQLVPAARIFRGETDSVRRESQRWVDSMGIQL